MSFTSRALTHLALLGILSFTSTAAVITYSDRSSFESAAPGLATETFDSGTPQDYGPFAYDNIAAPLDATTSNSVFAPGDLLPGFQILEAGGSNGDDTLLVYQSAATGNSVAVGANYFVATLDIAFTAGTNAFGFDFWTMDDLTALGSSLMTISLYDLNNDLIESFNVTSSSSERLFFGAISDTVVGRVNVAAAQSQSEIIDNLSFEAPDSAVPEPSTYAMLAGGFALMALLRKKKQSGVN